MREDKKPISRRQPFAVGRVVGGRLQGLPAAEGGGAGVGKQKG